MALPHRPAARSLAQAQKDLTTAMSIGDQHGRQQYARAARDSAIEAALDLGATDDERAAARLCAAQARTLTGEYSPLQRRARALGHEQSGALEVD
jgi:hypothetical protein